MYMHSLEVSVLSLYGLLSSNSKSIAFFFYSFFISSLGTSQHLKYACPNPLCFVIVFLKIPQSPSLYSCLPTKGRDLKTVERAQWLKA